MMNDIREYLEAELDKLDHIGELFTAATESAASRGRYPLGLFVDKAPLEFLAACVRMAARDPREAARGINQAATDVFRTAVRAATRARRLQADQAPRPWGLAPSAWLGEDEREDLQGEEEVLVISAVGWRDLLQTVSDGLGLDNNTVPLVWRQVGSPLLPRFVPITDPGEARAVIEDSIAQRLSGPAEKAAWEV